jgi:hypothetical protein
MAKFIRPPDDVVQPARKTERAPGSMVAATRERWAYFGQLADNAVCAHAASRAGLRPLT